ncbi:hypothetical protein HNP00_001867 [Arthrobacter sp. AZCC_0090]|nr:hypothetical protein [Arthrobacter sp. AZCC_0090]
MPTANEAVRYTRWASTIGFQGDGYRGVIRKEV